MQGVLKYNFYTSDIDIAALSIGRCQYRPNTISMRVDFDTSDEVWESLNTKPILL